VRVVQITDIHVGLTTPRRLLERVSDVIATLDADLVVLTGDYVNASLFFLDRVTEFVARLPKPCVATLGNHDHWTSAPRVSEALRLGGALVLQNASTEVELQGREPLVVVGVDDGCSKNADVDRAFEKVAHPERALVLTHTPSTADAIAAYGSPLVLSGHTHAGQIDVPRVTRPLARLVGHRYLRGFHRVGPTTSLYVSAGIGHSAPGLRRGRAAPEISIFDLDTSDGVGRRVSSRRRIAPHLPP
jgi:predicted MPP superfamily phosphohydrolase